MTRQDRAHGEDQPVPRVPLRRVPRQTRKATPRVRQPVGTPLYPTMAAASGTRTSMTTRIPDPCRRRCGGRVEGGDATRYSGPTPLANPPPRCSTRWCASTCSPTARKSPRAVRTRQPGDVRPALRDHVAPALTAGPGRLGGYCSCFRCCPCPSTFSRHAPQAPNSPTPLRNLTASTRCPVAPASRSGRVPQADGTHDRAALGGAARRFGTVRRLRIRAGHNHQRL